MSLFHHVADADLLPPAPPKPWWYERAENIRWWSRTWSLGVEQDLEDLSGSGILIRLECPAWLSRWLFRRMEPYQPPGTGRDDISDVLLASLYVGTRAPYFKDGAAVSALGTWDLTARGDADLTELHWAEDSLQGTRGRVTLDDIAEKQARPNP